MILSSGILVIVVGTLLTTLATELVLYAWIYRTPSFRSARDQLEAFQQNQDALGVAGRPKSKGKKLEREEDRLKREVTREMGRLRLKQAVVVRLLGDCVSGLRCSINSSQADCRNLRGSGTPQKACGAQCMVFAVQLVGTMTFLYRSFMPM